MQSGKNHVFLGLFLDFFGDENPRQAIRGDFARVFVDFNQASECENSQRPRD